MRDVKNFGILHLLDMKIIKERFMPVVSSQISFFEKVGLYTQLGMASSLWKAGRIAGWMEALMENSLQTFKSLVAAEQITALQVM